MIYCESREQFLNLFARLERARNACKHSFLFEPIPTASMRREFESVNTVEPFSWVDDRGDEYTAEQDVTVSCQHIYVKARYTRNGAKTNFTAVKNSAARMGYMTNE